MTERRCIRLAGVQMLVRGGEPEANRRRAARLVREAARAGAQLVVLPEAFDLGWTDESARELAEPVPGGRTVRMLRRLARTEGIYLAAGVTERDGSRFYNAAVLVGPDGRLLLHHRKVNELDFARRLYSVGSKLEVCDTGLGRIGLLVCADANAAGQVLSRALGYLGADLILLPSAWAVAPEHDLAKQPYGALWERAFRPVAREYRLWMVAVSSVGRIRTGEWQGWKMIGNSMAVDPRGEVVYRARVGADAEEVFRLELELVPRPAWGTDWEKVLT